MRVLIAAGNSGAADDPRGTIGSPATCKNCLAVGASQGDERDALKGEGSPILVASPPGAPEREFQGASASFGAVIDADTPATTLTGASFVGGEGCAAYNETFSFQGRAAVVVRGTCNFAEKAAHAQ
ncbi:hypothetical protein T484DRAFT_1814488, partial [Baffinella frigidus]